MHHVRNVHMDDRMWMEVEVAMPRLFASVELTDK